ncbi:hypothetical protein LINPERPRIM_LOCUS25301, partial [Linum perenne]
VMLTTQSFGRTLPQFVSVQWLGLDKGLLDSLTPSVFEGYGEL